MTAYKPFLCQDCANPIEYYGPTMTWVHTEPPILDHRAKLQRQDRLRAKLHISGAYGRNVLGTFQDSDSIHTVENDVDKRVEVLVYIPGVGHSVFTNVSLEIVNEAIAHINDNS